MRSLRFCTALLLLIPIAITPVRAQNPGRIRDTAAAAAVTEIPPCAKTKAAPQRRATKRPRSDRKRVIRRNKYAGEKLFAKSFSPDLFSKTSGKGKGEIYDAPSIILYISLYS